MVQIQFPDGAVRSYEKGITALGIAKSISEGLAKKVLAASINGEVWDATRPINKDAALKLLTWDDDAGKNTFWHSSAHLMAEAVEALYPGVKFWVGPALDKGFYYDIDLGGRNLTPEELVKVEQKMNELAKTDSLFLLANKYIPADNTKVEVKTGLADLKTKKATRKSPFFVRMRRFELPHPNGHHPLKVACLPVSPHARLRVCKSRNPSQSKQT
mgnify:CR=1 FL=1